MIRKIRQLLFRLSVPIQKVMQKIHPPYAQTTIAEADRAMTLMRDGDILLSRESWHFTNLFIPGFWSHAAIYGQDKVVESVAPCVQEVDFKDWVIEKHNWCVLRPKESGGIEAYLYAQSKKGVEYDYSFDGLNDVFYCSELALKSWKYIPKDQITPQDLYEMGFTLIYEHKDK